MPSFVFVPFQIMSSATGESPLNLQEDIKHAIDLLDRLRTTSEIPETKLLELQRIFQSDFFHAVLEVYEKIYETVQISGSPEVRANATAKATVRSSVRLRSVSPDDRRLGCCVRRERRSLASAGDRAAENAGRSRIQRDGRTRAELTDLHFAYHPEWRRLEARRAEKRRSVVVRQRRVRGE